MFLKTLVTCALLLFHSLRVVASPVIASVDDELVRVPLGGLIPKSKVHQVPEGGKILHTPTEVKLLDADGKILHTAPLTNSKPIFNHFNNRTGLSTIAPRSTEGIAEAIVQVPNLFSLLATWSLPPLPQKDSGQLLMYFSALGPASGDVLLLASFQYGVSAAGGGPFWAIASWLITSEEAFITNLTALSPGLTLVPAAIINNDEFAGTPTTHAWFCEIDRIAQLNIQTTEEFTIALNALETSNAVEDDNFPNEITEISPVSIETNGGSVVFEPIPWSFFDDTLNDVTIFDTTLSVTPDDSMMGITYPGIPF